MSAFAGCIAFAAVALVYLHNSQWNGYDDGMYVHVADRVARGEVLNLDVQDMHFGYVNFANAFALKLFGDDAVSLRYPLVFMGVASAALAFLLLAGAGTPYATAGSLAVTALSIVQFMNPSAHWYVLFLSLLTLAALAWLPRAGPGRHVAVGLLVALVILFRQLSGAFVAAGVVFYLLLELPQHAPGARRGLAWLGKVVLAVIGLGLAAYLVKKTDTISLVMYGVWPLAVLLWGVARLSPANTDVARTLARLSAGAAIATLPLAAYHVYHGSVTTWLDDTCVAAFSITRLDFIDDQAFWKSMAGGARALLRPAGVAPALVGLFWLVAPALPTVLGALVVWKLWRPSGRGGPDRTAQEPTSLGLRLGPVPVLAVFFFLVALHYQKWLYFFFGVPLTFMGLLALAPTTRKAYRIGITACTVALSVIAFLIVGGSIPRMWAARHAPLVLDHGVPRCSIYLEPQTAEAYRKIRELVSREVADDESILVLPVNPELYYLTGRRNPTRFYNTALGLRSAEDLRALVRQFEQVPPRLVFFNARNHYVTPRCRQLMDWVAAHYERLEPTSAFDVYRSSRRHPGAAAAAAAKEAWDGH